MPDQLTPPIVAAFDFDGTLTRGDTLGPFLRRALGWPRYLWLLLRCSPWLAAWVLRLISNHRAKAHLLQMALAGWRTEQAERHAQDFVRDFLPGFWHPWGLAQLRQHQRAGHRCVIVSASPGLYLHAVGQSLGVDAVLCTEMEVIDGHYTGRMATANCHGEEKVRRLQAWLAVEYGNGRPEMHAYGDTQGDLPMLRLARVAWYREKHWPRG
jgi:phosphatidylglycerophosphatase C